MRIHAIRTGNVLVKSAFLGSPATSGGILPYFANVFLDRSRVSIPVLAWAIEHPEGVIVVDTGENAVMKGNFITQSRYDLAPEQEIGAQLAALGIRPKDVSKVVLTHLHGDHVDGLRDFPNKPVWVSRREYKPFQSGAIASKIGVQLPEGFNPMLITFKPEAHGPFSHSFPLTSDGSVFAVPTPGHTAGHLSVVVVDEGIHTFIAGDVSYCERTLIDQQLEGPSMELALHRQTMRHVKDYTQQYPTVYLPSHDPESAQRLAAKQIVPQTSFQLESA